MYDVKHLLHKKSHNRTTTSPKWKFTITKLPKICSAQVCECGAIHVAVNKGNPIKVYLMYLFTLYHLKKMSRLYGAEKEKNSTTSRIQQQTLVVFSFFSYICCRIFKILYHKLKSFCARISLTHLDLKAIFFYSVLMLFE